ncbi:hypothetical protein GCM10010387_15560 [Streptomyces inusitatus]|uniref:Uncharacterized protein n=1 Tax=Streptomyces inusitatus TaxID=68221 RepID=A0A918UNM6_9ACTN|nr:hypothetical protein [Streptomyces inusitatus]GGZ23321.1 hypothetical protein GCM10010387_15560 [Streptomyces inusitatus]
MPVQPLPCGPDPSAGDPGFDVEGSLLCDIDANGDLIAVALVEAVYDAETGVRTGTRLVNPATGALYVVQGTLQPCPADCKASEWLVLCDVVEDVGPAQAIWDTTQNTDQGWLLTASADPAPANGVPPSPPIVEADGSGTFSFNIQPGHVGNFAGVYTWTKTFNAPTAGPYDLAFNATAVDDVWSGVRVNGSPLTPSNGTQRVTLAAGANTIEMDLRNTVTGHAQLGVNTTFAAVTDTCAPFLRRIVSTCSGTVESTADFTMDATTPHVLTGTPQSCDTCGSSGSSASTPAGPDVEVDKVCDQGVTLDRVRVFDSAGNATTEVFYGTGGAPVATPTGYTPGPCLPVPCGDTEHLVLCDTAVLPGSTPATFNLTENQTVIPTTSFFSAFKANGGWAQSPTTAAQEQAFWDSAAALTFPAGSGAASPNTPVFRSSIGADLDFTTDCGYATGDVTFTVDLRNTSLDNPGSAGPDYDIAEIALLNKATGAKLAGTYFQASEFPVGGPAVLKSLTASNVPASAFPNLVLVVWVVTWSNYALQGLHSNSFEANFHGATVNLDGTCSRTEFLRTLTRDCTGTVTATTDTELDGVTPYVVTGDVSQCTEPSGSDTRTLVDPGTDAETITLCDDNGPFLRTFLTDVNGVLTVVRDSDLAGLPYSPVGTVGLCKCGDTECELLCDVVEGSANPPTPPIAGQPTTTDRAPTHNVPGIPQVPGGGAAFWSGGTTHFPVGSPQPPGTQTAQAIEGLITAPVPPCVDPAGTVQVDISFRLHQLGPNAGFGGTGGMTLYNGAASVAFAGPPSNTPPGYLATLTLTATVPVADLVAGNISAYLGLESAQTDTAPGAQQTVKAWDADQFTITLEFQDVIPCAASVTPFRRCTTYDCNGNPTGTTDTDLGGAPYLVQGEARDCGRTDAEETILCDDNGPFLRHTRYTEQGAVAEVYDTDLTGAVYTTVGTVGVCPTPDVDRAVVVLCDTAAGGAMTPFLRHVLTDETGAVLSTADTALDGTTPYAPTGTVGVCQPKDPAVVGEFILCDNAGPFVRKLIQTAAGAVTAVVNLTLAGAPYVPVGTVKRCDDCPTVLGEVCYSPPLPGARLSDNWAGSTSTTPPGSRVWTNPNFAGVGITVTETVTPDTGAALTANGVRNTATSPATQHTSINLGALRSNVVVRLEFFGAASGERLRNISPAFDTLTGNGTAVLGNTGVDGGPAADGIIDLTFIGPVQTIAWDYAPTGAGLSVQSNITFTEILPGGDSARAARVHNCDGTYSLTDLRTGTVLNEATISVFDCPCCPTTTAELVCADGAPAIRRETVDADGTVTAEVFTTAGGNVITPAAWTPGPCAAVAVTAQHKDVTAGTSWTPADAGGTVTALTYTVLAGTATVTDQNGTAVSALPTGLTVSWENNEEGTLSPPQSVTADVGSRVLVHWTVAV